MDKEKAQVTENIVQEIANRDKIILKEGLKIINEQLSTIYPKYKFQIVPDVDVSD